MGLHKKRIYFDFRKVAKDFYDAGHGELGGMVALGPAPSVRRCRVNNGDGVGWG